MADEIDKILSREADELSRDEEVERVMKSFRLDAYAILDIQPGAPESDIKAIFRKKSLLIHPDKCKHPKAPDAFNLLKQAEAELMDTKKREYLDNAIADARKLVIREHKLTLDSDEVKTDWFLAQVRGMTKKVLIDEELRRRRQKQIQLAHEGREKAELEAGIKEMKRKREDQKAWEQTRETRIHSWREFQKKKTDKEGGKKKKTKVLG